MEQPLHSLSLERAILSTIIFEPKSFDSAAALIKPEHFYFAPHQMIYSAIVTLAANQSPIDEEFIRKQLAKEDRLNEEALLDVLATSPLSNLLAYIEELTELHIKRELVDLTVEIRRAIYDERLDSIEAVDRVQKRLFEIGVDSGAKLFRDAEEIIRSTLAQIETNKKRGNKLVIGLDTGFYGLNKITAGFGAGDMIVIAARPSMGKTAFMLNLVSNVLNDGGGAAVFSLEMPAEQLMLRLLSGKTSIPLQRIKLGNLDDNEWGRMIAACDFFAQSKLFVNDDGFLTLPKLRGKLRQLILRHPEVKIAAIDYLQLMTGTGNKERHLEVSDISRGIKMLSRELNIPIVALSQLNRALETRRDKRPMLADIRESGAIEQDADIVMFVHREDVYKAQEAREKSKEIGGDKGRKIAPFVEKPIEDAEIIVEKHRNGETGAVKMTFHKACVRFEDSTIPLREGGEIHTRPIELPPEVEIPPF
ncbi:MAG: replicative DNA helicase [Helicobacteraceae bacterium]|nr:replicative DNA helicase [Helicobacteraceae bacterium]